MDSCDNKVFGQSEEKFARLDELLKVSFNVFEITLLPLFEYNSEDGYDLFTSSQICKPNGKRKNVSLCIVNETWEEGKNELPKHFLYIKDLSDFKHRIFR